MNYKVNEIFYSLQAEGKHAGTAAVFVRLCGCNLKCPWCDTKYHTQGEMYTKEELEEKVRSLAKDENAIVVFTGGEPTLQLKEEEELLPEFYRAIETNGTNPVPSWINWVTCSPKTDILFPNKTLDPDEVKVVYEYGRDKYLKKLAESYQGELYLQPLELNGKMNTQETVDFIKENPRYKLSLQFHKIIGIR